MPKVIIDPAKGLFQESGSGDVAFGVASTSVPGAGLLSTEVAPSVRVSQINDEVVTTIKLDLTGLDHSNALGDIVGLGAGGAATLLQYKVATHGILTRAEIHCIELPTASSNPLLDFDIISDDAGTLVEDQAPSTNNVTVLASAADVAKGKVIEDTALGVPTDEQYLYLCVGAAPGGAATHTAGKLVIKLFGHKSF